MRAAAILRGMAVTGLVLGVAGSATAQSGGASVTADAQVGFQQKVQLSPKDELAQADAILTRLDQASGAVRRQLERARTAPEAW